MIKYAIKTIVMLVVLALFVPAFVPAIADAKSDTSVFVNGKKIVYSQAPITENNTTLVSARETMEGLGLSFSWDKANKRVIGTNGEMTLTLTLGSPVGTVNGVSVFLGSPAVERNGRIMIPLRFLLDGLGATMQKKGSQLNIATAPIEKSNHYTGLPLEITNTAVKNLSNESISVTYATFMYLYEDNTIYRKVFTMQLAPGQKSAFEHASASISDRLNVEGKRYEFYGRAVQSITIGEEEIPSLGYDFANRMYMGKEFDKNLRTLYEKFSTDMKKKLKEELKKNKNIPLKIDSSAVVKNAYNYSDAEITVTNLTEKRIVSFELSFSCYDAYNDPVNRSFTTSNRFYGKANDISVKMAETYTFTWDLFSFSGTSKISNVKIDKVAFSDGTVWKRK
ncbi:hypothetical protein PAECIP111893_04189 [Paenibacillus plantiphilus]|uniref:Copper amine oxidase-like N-terminal domain-containing protein n=1 Tax=Paenibacillus plantiphilus TaxID=2905650 RepID=A0ABM9CMP6_9BACL|nr:stalk domain-containing protein [Paenibacillus plantiphilus]CAH1216853.1 hypothetical protein PAECIP111893_04189 [Paenibacillus plantiphilus]